MVDIHPCGARERARMMMPRPYQIPMAALISERVVNLLAAGKNIGVTHIRNGSYRLHPVEWNVGKAAATIAALEMETGQMRTPPSVRREPARAGVPLVWFDDLPLDDPSLSAIQLAAIRGLYPVSARDLRAAPEAMVTRGEAAQVPAVYYGLDWFHADIPFYLSDLDAKRLPGAAPGWRLRRTGPVRRRELAEDLTGLFSDR